MGGDQQPVGEPDADQQQAAGAQQRQGAAHADDGETGSPVQQRWLADIAPLDGQVQRGGACQCDGEDQYGDGVERHGRTGLPELR